MIIPRSCAVALGKSADTKEGDRSFEYVGDVGQELKTTFIGKIREYDGKKFEDPGTQIPEEDWMDGETPRIRIRCWRRVEGFVQEHRNGILRKQGGDVYHADPEDSSGICHYRLRHPDQCGNGL